MRWKFPPPPPPWSVKWIRSHLTTQLTLTYFKHSFFLLAPLEIEARGEKAQLAYQSALKDGAVNVYRGRVLLIGEDRAGKTSLKKSLIGLPFNPKEKRNEAIEVDGTDGEKKEDSLLNQVCYGKYVIISRSFSTTLSSSGYKKLAFYTRTFSLN